MKNALQIVKKIGELLPWIIIAGKVADFALNLIKEHQNGTANEERPTGAGSSL